MDRALRLTTTNWTPLSCRMAPNGSGCVNRITGGGLIIFACSKRENGREARKTPRDALVKIGIIGKVEYNR